MRVPEHSVRTLPRREYPVHFVSVSCHIFRIAGYLSVVRTSLFAQNTCNLQRAASKPAVDQSAATGLVTAFGIHAPIAGLAMQPLGWPV